MQKKTYIIASKPQHKAFSLIEISLVILVIGILISGVGKAVDLYYDYKIFTARKFTLNSRVGRIPDLNLWLETTTEKSLQNANDSFVLRDGDTIKNWHDIKFANSQKFIASQAINNDRPVYRKDGINGLPTLFFDVTQSGSDYFGKKLTIPNDSSLNTQTFTLFVVTQPLDQHNTWGTVVMSRNGGVPSGYILYKNINNTKWEFWTGHMLPNSDWWGSAIPNTSISFRKPIILTCIRNLNNQNIYENSTLVGTLTRQFTRNTDESFAIGGINVDAYLFPYDGNISEIIFYGRNLPDKERIEVETYLSKKYNIKI